VWKKTETDSPASHLAPSSPPPRPSTASRDLAVIGPSITIHGDISGEESLHIDGRIEGEIQLGQYNVTVGRAGRVKADIHGRRIRIEGEVEGDLFGDEDVVLCETGKVEGNITSPQVSLEKGSSFRGSIDMSPRSTGRETQDSGKGSRESKPSASSGSTAVSAVAGTAAGQPGS
jgi:cytoskeletal protein CcmA (bactofilin family)